MSVGKQLKAKSGYGMLVAVAVALIVIIGLFIWSTIGLASTPDGVDAPAVYGWGLGLSILAFCLWFIPLNGFFSLQPGQARVHPVRQVRGHRPRRGPLLGQPVL